MGKRWFLYLTALLGCLIFYIAYQQWVSWILLLFVLLLPPLSLVVSLPAMLTARARQKMPPAIAAGTPLQMNIDTTAWLPMPTWHMYVQVYHTFTQENLLLEKATFCPTAHCGALNCKPHRGWVYDHLGMFRVPLRAPEPFRILVRPEPLPLPEEPDLSNVLVNAWRPKVGGGFAENHELRLYRPGDSLQQIHWKLTAKTGKLILREPMVPDRMRLLLWLNLHGSAQELDRKLGRLLWLGGYLQRQGLPFDILAFTGSGKQLWHVGSAQALRKALDTLLCLQPSQTPGKPALTEIAAWDYYIGGEEDEEI